MGGMCVCVSGVGQSKGMKESGCGAGTWYCGCRWSRDRSTVLEAA